MEKTKIAINEYDNPKYKVYRIDEYDKFLNEVAEKMDFVCFSKDREVSTADGTPIVFKKTSIDMPLTYNFGFNCNVLYIDREYYKENKEKIKDDIKRLIKITKSKKFTIANKEFIDDDIIEELLKNPNIEEISFEDDYTISKETIEKITKKPNIKTINVPKVEDELRFVYNPKVIAANQNNICGLSLEEVVKSKDSGDDLKFYVTREYNEEELDALRTLISKFPVENINISFTNKNQMKEILDIFKDSKIAISYNRNFSLEELKELEKHENIILEQIVSKFTPAQVRGREEILNIIIEEVNNQDLSPLEQYMYLYNVVKLFKEYKESEDNKQSARVSEYTLENEYMVCVGYASLLDELVKKLNNPNIKTNRLSVKVDGDGHERLLVNINDPKYDINGVYISDPTWDCVSYYKKERIGDEVRTDYTKPISDVDKYVHFLLTKEEVSSDGCEYEPDITDILFSDDYMEIINKINSDPKKRYIVSNCITALKELFNTDDINQDNLSEYCKNIRQPYIDGDTIMTCVANLYSKIYKDSSPEKRQEIIEKTIDNNIIMQERSFNANQDKFSK